MPDKSSNMRLVDDGESAVGNHIDESLVASVEVALEARLGSARMSIAKLMDLKTGDSITLDAALNQDVELRLNGVTVARGELVVVGDSFGVRITQIAAK